MNKAFTKTHKRYHDAMRQSTTRPILIGVGPAGCGKTHIACQVGLSKLLANEVKKIIITRPAIVVDESHGYLPGCLREKMAPYMIPIYESFLESISQRQLDKFMNDSLIEVAPFAFMRGRTFNNAFVIADESQNITKNQMKNLLTRMGESSQLVITGDLQQSDLLNSDGSARSNGLSDIIERVRRMTDDLRSIEIVEFSNDDILRSAILPEVLAMYDQEI
jgi:phosphate starvation-inducible PhoH-like protein